MATPMATCRTNAMRMSTGPVGMTVDADIAALVIGSENARETTVRSVAGRNLPPNGGVIHTHAPTRARTSRKEMSWSVVIGISSM